MLNDRVYMLCLSGSVFNWRGDKDYTPRAIADESMMRTRLAYPTHFAHHSCETRSLYGTRFNGKWEFPDGVYLFPLYHKCSTKALLPERSVD